MSAEETEKEHREGRTVKMPGEERGTNSVMWFRKNREWPRRVRIEQRLDSTHPHSVGQGEEELVKYTKEAVLSWKPGGPGVLKRDEQY